MSETLGHLRIVRDGDDCHWLKNTSNLFMFDGNIYRDQRNGYNPFGVTIGGMLPEYTTTVTPVRLEPCPAPGWRTDVEIAPKDGTRIIVGWEDTSSTTQAHYDEHEKEWCDDDGCYLLLPTHWMPIPTLPEANT